MLFNIFIMVMRIVALTFAIGLGLMTVHGIYTGGVTFSKTLVDMGPKDAAYWAAYWSLCVMITGGMSVFFFKLSKLKA